MQSSFEDLKIYIEKKFTDGMNWENYGRKEGCWNIDHIIPPHSAQTEQDIISLQHYTNLRPMWHSDNIRKRNKRGQGTVFVVHLHHHKQLKLNKYEN